MKRAVLFLIIAITSQHAFSGGLKEIPKIQGQIYAEPFFGFKGNWKQPQYRESFLFNYNRHNEVSLNLALVKITLDHSKYRGALGFHTGTYVRDNYISEPLPMQFIHEARAGIALFGSKKLWLDMGIMNSFLGFESPIGMENPTLTRSLTAENSPYYLSGARLAWEDSTFSFAIHYLNGWQRIQRPPDNNQAAVGTEVKWTPTAKATFAWNTYAGSERVANTLRRRYFNNLYWKQDLGSKWKLILGLDAGIQETADKQAWDDWWNTTLIVQYIGHKKYRFAYRAEYFQDSANVVSIDQFPSFMMEAFGTSLNMDYLIHDKAMLRGEYRYLHRLNKASANPDSHLFTLSICMNFLK